MSRSIFPLFTMIIHRFVVAEWVITVCISTFLLCCNAQSPDSGQTTISKEAALEVTKSFLRTKGVNLKIIEMGAVKEVQSIPNWKVHLGRDYESSLVKEYEVYVGERLYWEVICHEIGTLGAVIHVFVDAVTGDVLGIYDGEYLINSHP
jgi:hypothetical protein